MDLIGHIESKRDENLNELKELLRIPSVSTKSEHRPDIERAARWVAGKAVFVCTGDTIDKWGHSLRVLALPRALTADAAAWRWWLAGRRPRRKALLQVGSQL